MALNSLGSTADGASSVLVSTLRSSAIVLPLSQVLDVSDGGMGNALWDLAGARPSLDLDFATTKSLADRISGQNLITFGRAGGTATYVNATGAIVTAAANEPRFTHDPVTLRSLGLLVEEPRTNLLLMSEEFDNASWAKSGLLAFGSGSTADAIAAPSGAVSADLVTEDATTREHYIEQSFSATSGTTYAFSFFAKAGANKTTIVVRLTTPAWSGGLTNQVRFDLSTGASTIIAGSPVAFSQSFGNGWWRFTIVSTASSTGSPAARVHFTDSSGNTNYQGDGTSGIYLWGAQLEAGAFPTSYIPTTGTQATRNADVATITGAAFSSWYRQDEGTLYGDVYRESAVLASPFPVIADCRTTAGGIDIVQIGYLTEGNARAFVAVSGVSQSELTPSIPANTRRRLIAFAYATNNFAASANGSAPLTDFTGSVGSPTSLVIGATSGGGQNLNGTISRLTYWPQPLPTKLQAITA